MDINTFGLGDILNLNRVRHRDKKLLPQAACIYFAVASQSPFDSIRGDRHITNQLKQPTTTLRSNHRLT